MTELSWLIYLADVVEMSGAIIINLFAFTLVFIFATSTFIMFASNDIDFTEECKIAKKYRDALIFPVMILGLLLIVMPTRDTVLIIAAVETGHDVASSEDGKEIIDAIKAKILTELGIEE